MTTVQRQRARKARNAKAAAFRARLRARETPVEAVMNYRYRTYGLGYSPTERHHRARYAALTRWSTPAT